MLDFNTEAAKQEIPGLKDRATKIASTVEKTKASSLSGALEYALPKLDEAIAQGTATPEYTRKFISKVHDLAFDLAVTTTMIALIADVIKSRAEGAPIKSEDIDALLSAGGRA